MKITKATGTCWGESLSVEVRTDEEVTGWGEITTTTWQKVATADQEWTADIIPFHQPFMAQLRAAAAQSQ